MAVSVSLNWECFSDDLNEAQKEFYSKRIKEYDEFQTKFDNLIGNRTDVSVEKGETCSFLEYYTASGFSQAQVNPVPNNGRILQTSSASPLLVVNSRLGILAPTSTVGATPIIVSTTNSSNALTLNNATIVTAARTVNSAPKAPVLLSTVDQLNGARSPTVAGQIHLRQKRGLEGLNDAKDAAAAKVIRLEKFPLIKNYTAMPPLVTAPAHTSKVQQPLPKAQPAPKPQPPPKPQTQPYATISIDLTEELSPAGSSPNSFPGGSGKTYPSLVVMAKPCIRGEKDHKNPFYAQEKASLDQRMKQVLLLSRDKFTEWLIQIGLLRCDLHCGVHRNIDGSKVKLKLGMFTDSTKFPFSGGYVWVSDCCPQQCVSVFTGSLFESTSYPPSSTIKLIYHWACHTSIQNIMQWVEVSNIYIKNLFTNLRAVCTAAVHEHFEKMGGPGKKIQLGVVSLGSSKSNEDKRVRIEILCIFDPETKYLRLRAVEPFAESEKFAHHKKFSRIFETLPSWVDTSSTVLVDNTIDKNALFYFGYKSISNEPVKDKFGQDQFPNYQIMDYLRHIIPKMFKNTLGVLSRIVIQQFLDELVWRERFGYYSAKAFDAITKHLIEQTKLNSGGPLLNRLSKISANPFRNWKYENWNANANAVRSSGSTQSRASTGGSSSGAQPAIPPGSSLLKSSNPASQQKAQKSAAKHPVATPTQPPPLVIADDTPLQEPHFAGVPSTSLKDDDIVMTNLQVAQILLEPYFYGTIRGTKSLQNRKMNIKLKCFSCSKKFDSPLELTDHLVKHGLNKSLTSGDLKELCKICLKIFPSQYFLQKHHVQVHSEDQSDHLCRICHWKFKDQPSLIAHMSRVHLELELPYKCTVCDFKTSIFMNMLAHIDSCHKSDNVGFCPYCFKVVQYVWNGKLSAKNQFNFICHIQRHQLPMNKKCMKCVIRCINRTVLAEHELEEHKSHNRVQGVERCTDRRGTIMPAPLCDPPEPKDDRYKLTLGGPYKIVDSTSQIRISEEDQKHACIECDAKLSNSHFISELLCMKCDYSTFCLRAMSEHHTTAHVYNSTNIYRLDKNIPTLSNKVLQCACRFSTKDGNLMAMHLVCCKKETAWFENAIEKETDGNESEDVIPDPTSDSSTPSPNPDSVGPSAEEKEGSQKKSKAERNKRHRQKKVEEQQNESLPGSTNAEPPVEPSDAPNTATQSELLQQAISSIV